MTPPQKHKASDAFLVLSVFAGMIRKFRMYPLGHPAVPQAMRHLIAQFDRYFSGQGTLSLGVGRDRLYVNDVEYLGDEWIDALATMLHGHSISHLVLHRGLNEKDLSTFMDLLYQDPLLVREAGGHKYLLVEKGVTAIEVSEIEYELDPDAGRLREEALSDVEIWRRVARHQLHSQGDLTDADLSFMRHLISNAPRLATILDSAIGTAGEPQKTRAAVDVFFGLIVDLMPLDMAGGQGTVTAYLQQIERIVESVRPASRYAMLARIAQTAEARTNDARMVEDIFHELEDKPLARALFEGLRPENGTIKEFCDTYLRFARRSREEGVLDELDGALRDQGMESAAQNAWLTERLIMLPDHEPALCRLRDRMMAAFKRQKSALDPLYEFLRANAGSADDLIATLADRSIEETATLNLFDVLELVKNSDTYEFFAEGLDDLIVQLIASGQYQLAEEAARVVRRHASGNNDAEVSRKLARRIIRNLQTEDMVEHLLTALGRWGKQESKSLGFLLGTMGARAHESIFQALVKEENRAVRAALVDILARFGTRVCDKAKEGLRDSNWYVARNMVALLARIGPEDLVDCLQCVINHPEPRVRKEVAKALGGTDDKTGVALLGRLLDDTDLSVRHQAILSLTRFHDSADAAQLLCDRLVEPIPFQGDAASQVLALQSLARIRSQVARPFLLQCLEAKTPLALADDSVVAAVAKAIANVGGADMLAMGLRSRHRPLRQACQNEMDLFEKEAHA